MTGIGSEIHELLHEAGNLDHSPAQAALLERATALADGLRDEDLMLRTRLQLTAAYEHGGQPARALGTISWQLSLLKSAPERFPRNTLHSALWQLKYPFSTMVRFPQVSLARTAELLDEVEAVYRFHGKSLHPIHGCRHRIAAHIGDLDLAEQQYQLWLATPRDDLADCSGCDPELQMQWLIQTGRDEEALNRAADVLSGRLSCIEQPHSIMSTLLPAYVRTGRLDQAAEAHLRAYRAIRRLADRSMLNKHLVFCGRTGNQARGLELVELLLPSLPTAPSPYDAMQQAAGSALVLRRIVEDGHGDLEVRTPEGPVTAAVLQAELSVRAQGLAAEFDARNGNPAQGEQIREILDAEPWVDELPLQLGRRSTARPAARPTSRAAAGPRPGRSLDELVTAAKNSQRLDADESKQVLAELGSQAEDPTLTPEQAGWAGLASVWSADHDHHRAERAAVLAAAAFRAADQPHWALIASAMALRHRLAGDPAAPIEDTVAQLRARLAGDPVDPRASVELAEVLARLLLHAGRDEEATAELDAVLARIEDPFLNRRLRRMRSATIADLSVQVPELTQLRQDYLDAGHPGRAAGAAIPLGIGLSTSGADHEVIVALVTESLPQLPADETGTLYHLRGDALLALNRPAEAIPDLGEAVAVLTAEGARTQAGYAANALGTALLEVGRTLEAAEVLESALPTFDETDPVQAAYLRRQLVRAMVRLRELDSAADEADRILADTAAAEAWGDQAELALDLGNLLQTRRADVAVRLFRAATEACDRMANALWAARAQKRLGATLLMLDRDEGARALAEARDRIEALPPSEHYSAADELADWNYQAGWAYWNVAEDDRAQAYLSAAETAYTDLGDRYWAARSMVLRGESLADLERPADALPVITAARTRFAELGAEQDRDRADGLIARCQEALAG